MKRPFNEIGMLKNGVEAAEILGLAASGCQATPGLPLPLPSGWPRLSLAVEVTASSSGLLTDNSIVDIFSR